MTSITDQKNVVVLGGSYGGISTAHYLLKHAIPRLPEKESYKIILVSPSSQAMCRPACPRALISDDLLPQDKLFVNIQAQFAQYSPGSFRFVQGAATQLDHLNRVVRVQRKVDEAENINYHALIIATGASTTSPLFSFSPDEKVLKETWNKLRQGLSTAKSIAIVGGGPTGVETAGELGEYLNGRAGWFGSGTSNPKVEITLITADDKILPVLRPAIANKAEKMLAQVGVAVLKKTRVVNTVPADAGTGNINTKATLTFQNGETMDADLFIPATGFRPNTSFMDTSLLTPNGRVDVNASSLRAEKAGPRVYAVGDCSSYARPAVHNILAAIPVLCANIKRDLLLAAGQDEAVVGSDRAFKEDTRETQMVPIGRSKGVGAAMGYKLPSFLVWLIKGRDYWLWTTGGLWIGKQWAKES